MAATGGGSNDKMTATGVRAKHNCQSVVKHNSKTDSSAFQAEAMLKRAVKINILKILHSQLDNVPCWVKAASGPAHFLENFSRYQERCQHVLQHL